MLVDVARAVLHEDGEGETAVQRAIAAAEDVRRRLLQPLVNATGVLLHTNLGRAPLPVDRVAGYSNLEFNVNSGTRGNRSAHAAALIARACEAEGALVVNNGAAAILLALAALAGDKEVIVSRGELVEIGGGFRIPEILATSGAQLVEIGTTNRTRIKDYQTAIGPLSALVLKVHTSNFRISGFTESVSVQELKQLGTPVVVDLGSGLVDSACPWLPDGPPQWLAGEPACRQTLSAGADLITFSGDKLFGGPQAGIIAGSGDLVERCRRHPLARALRPGGMVLEALQDVALAYLRRDAGFTVPLWKLATTPLSDLRRRAERLGVGEVVDSSAPMGGGTLPGVLIPSVAIAVEGDISAPLRSWVPPVIARVEKGRTLCELRSVFEHEDEHLGNAIRAASASHPRGSESRMEGSRP
jgi:L-seryl-tRNA(Ser) seleniumtransferase